MRILYCRCFGLGNAVMAVPAIKALAALGHHVDVLVGVTSDDVGALEVMESLRRYLPVIGCVWIGSAPISVKYDLAILAIPFDGRWQNGIHFSAKDTLDGRTRPDPTTTGLVSWKKHEVEYQMDNVVSLGYDAATPDCRFVEENEWDIRPRVFYLGVGYKKDPAGFWKQKHWGNENYAELVKRILDDHKMNLVVTTGDIADLKLSIRPIQALVGPNKRFMHDPSNLPNSLRVVSFCGTYVGNDTGMMHVAAASDRKVVGIFKMWNSSTKARPWCDSSRVCEGTDEAGDSRTITVEEVFSKIKELGDDT